MTIQAGATLLHYRLVEPIGEGGMGVVWRASDTSLGRDVALKFLPAGLAQDAERRARFEREARVLAQLAHPAIASVFGYHEHDGHVFLAMEYVPGEDLAARLTRGALEMDDALVLAARLAAALEAAHERGIVHRDLKPANIKFTADGGVKVLDFGLAKAIGVSGDSGETPPLSHLPTVTSAGTKAGTILGTAAYMSPEQARGRAIDRRTDLWAFGCVLFEMLSGRRVFDGETMSDTLAAVLRADPDWDALPPRTPRAVRDLLRRCLEKDAALRWRDAGDARLLLDEAARGGDGADPSATATHGATIPAQRRIPHLAVLALLATGFALGLAWAAMSWRTPSQPVAVLDAHVPVGPEWKPERVRLSPDGRTLAIVAVQEGESRALGGRLLLRRLDDPRPRVVTGRLLRNDVEFSTDSRQIAFCVVRHGSGNEPALVRAPVADPDSQTLVTPWKATWTDTFEWDANGDLLVNDFDTSEILAFPTDGRPAPPPRAVRVPPGTFLLSGALPGGDFYGTVQQWEGGYHQDLVRLDADTGEVTLIADRAFVPHYLESGYFVFSRADQLVAFPYDTKSGRATGAQRTVASGLRWDLDLTAALYSLSREGDLVHLTGGSIGSRRRLVWVDRETGAQTVWRGAEAPYLGDIDDSQDSRVLAATILGSDELFQIWASESDEPSFRPVVAMPGMDCDQPLVSDDGTLIAARCISGSSDRDGIFVARFSRTAAEPERVLASGADDSLAVLSWLPGARELLIDEARGTSRRLLRLALDAEGRAAGEPVEVPGTGTNVLYAMVDPDARHIALVTQEAGSRRLSIASWNDGVVGAPVPVATLAGTGADWVRPMPDGRHELVFVAKDGVHSRVLVDARGRFSEAEPIPALAKNTPWSRGEAFLGDGRVVIIGPDEAELKTPDIRLVTGWASTWQEESR